MSRNPIQNAVLPISKRDLKTCKKCGCPNLAWVQFKSGKWGLVHTTTERPLWRGEGPAPEGLFAAKFAHHNCAAYLEEQARREALKDPCHPKAANPAAILADAASRIIRLAMEEPGKTMIFCDDKHPLTEALTLIVEAQSRCPRAIQ